MSIKDLKENLAYSCNILANEGHWDNILGHVTVRIPGTNKALMKPHGFRSDEHQRLEREPRLFVQHPRERGALGQYSRPRDGAHSRHEQGADEAARLQI